MMLTQAEKSGVDGAIESWFGPVVEWLSDLVFATFPLGSAEMPFLIVWLLLGGFVLSALIGPQIVYGMRQVPGIVKGRFNRRTDPGEITSYQALATELSGTVGLGNVAGVAVAIVVTGLHTSSSADGVALTSEAFGTVHALFPWLLTAIVLLLAFSTLLSYSYYGKKSAGYLFGNSRAVELSYDALWIVMIVVGAAVSLDTVVGFSDAMFFLVTLPNFIGLYLLSGVLRRELSKHTRDYANGDVPEVPEAERSQPNQGSTVAPGRATATNTPGR